MRIMKQNTQVSILGKLCAMKDMMVSEADETKKKLIMDVNALRIAKEVCGGDIKMFAAFLKAYEEIDEKESNEDEH